MMSHLDEVSSFSTYGSTYNTNCLIPLSPQLSYLSPDYMADTPLCVRLQEIACNSAPTAATGPYDGIAVSFASAVVDGLLLLLNSREPTQTQPEKVQLVSPTTPTYNVLMSPKRQMGSRLSVSCAASVGVCSHGLAHSS